MPGRLVVVGSSAVDITAKVSDNERFIMHSTAPGTVVTSLGGVARNVAEAAHRRLSASSASLGSSTVLLSVIGQDAFGRMLIDESQRMRMRTDGLMSSMVGRTAVCNMMLDTSGNLVGGVADMDIVHALDPSSVRGRNGSNTSLY